MFSINLTTTDSRLHLCSSTVWSLLSQSLKPDLINIWVSKDAYMSDKGIGFIPKWIDDFNNINNIIRLNFVDNTGPYRKFFPALNMSSSSDIIAYADDDVIYGENWLKLLFDCYIENEGKFVVASRVRLRKKNILGYYKSYNMAKLVSSSSLLKSDYIITGVGGCIFKKSDVLSEFHNNTDYLSLAPRADDLWISSIFQISNATVMVCPQALECVYEISHDMNSLNSYNNISLDGNLFMKIYKRVKMKVLGYLGLRLSNNDKILEKLSRYFNK